MKYINEREMISKLDEIIYILGNRSYCYLFHTDQKISIIKLSINTLNISLRKVSFMRVNFYYIINTKYYLSNNPYRKKEIILKNGIILEVSRKAWKIFENMT